MDGGLVMEDTIKAYVDADRLIGFINLPSSFYGKKVEITIKDVTQKKDTPIADKFAGIAAGLGMTAEEVRSARLGYEDID